MAFVIKARTLVCVMNVIFWDGRWCGWFELIGRTIRLEKMHIFIDESGTFTKPGTKTLSAVGALVVPDRRLPYLLNRYLRIRKNLPKENGEVKGRLLSEHQIAAVVDQLQKADVLFELSVIDMEMHSEDDVRVHKSGQEHGVTSYLTEEHHPNLRIELHAFRAQLEQMSHQLYVQSVLTFDVIARVLRHSTIYYVQRLPRELASFSWVVDAKDRSNVTPWEEWWSMAVMPILQSKFLREPMWHLVGADYSHYDRQFRTTASEYIRELFQGPKATEAIDLKKIMSENIRFSSTSEPGLELVDILTNAVRRAMVGNLQFEGYKDLPNIMVHRKSHYIQVVSLANGQSTFTPSYMPFLNHFRHGGKSMVRERRPDL